MKKNKNFLDFIPVINDEYKWDEKEGIVTVHVVYKGFYHTIAQKLFKTPKVSHIALDEYGSFVWRNIDGENSVYDIGVLVKEKYKEKAEPLYERLVQFFKILKNNRFIVIKGN